MTRPTRAEALSADFVIIGAGMAGLYTAWRLLQQNPGRRIRVLEKLPRTGGRLETDHVLIDGTSIKTEEGGMRFLNTHVELLALLKTLGLSNQIVAFPMGDQHNLYYLRGKRFTVGDATKDPSVWSKLYALNPGAVGQQPGNVLTRLLTSILEENHVDPKTWQGTPDNWTVLRMDYTYRGIPTGKWGFWAMLADYGLSPDCIEMLYQSSGFVAPYDQEVNAGCALQLLVDFVNPTFHTLGQGYEALPDALAAAITKAGATIHLQHEVTAIDREGDQFIVSATRRDGAETRVSASELVLAVTQLALQDLIPYVPMFRENDQFVDDVNAVTDMELGKINLYYDKNWWTPATGITSGGSYTDLPLAQFYCFADQGSTTPGGPASITIYSDFYRTAYWAQLQLLGEPYRVSNGPSLPASSVPASTLVVEQVTRQLQEMFGLSAIPAPLVATYRRWGVASAGDGDQNWRFGVDDRQVRARLSNPFPHVYTCGESYSDDQAWVNGALRSVDQMLAAHFGIAPLSSTSLASAGT
jgi:monoamine oxidase